VYFVKSKDRKAPCYAVCSKNTELLNVTVGGAYGNHWPFKD
jgi:hypothetical protein